MRSLFHFPLPAQPPSQQPSPTATVSLQSEMCHRPHPAPMRRQRRSPALLSAARPLPRSRAYLDPAHGPLSPAPRAPAMPRPHPCLAPPPAPIAPHHLSTAPLLPAPPRPHRAHRVPPSASLYVATEQIPRSSPPPSRPPRADIRIAPHLSPRVAAAPGPWPARTAPYASLFRRMREKGPLPGNIRPKCMLFEIRMATSSPHASIPGRNRAIRDTWRANLAAKGPFPRRGTRNHAWREDVASAARPFRGSGMRSGGTGFAPCGAGLACLPHARPCHLACARRGLRPLPSRPRSSPPSYMRRASPSETRHAVPVPMHLAICAPHPSRQPRGPTASRKQAEQHKQLNAGIKIGSPNRDPIEELFGFAQRLPDALQPLHQANELALSYLDHSTRQRLGGYVIGLSGNSFTVDLYAALVDHATSIAR